MPLRFLFGPVEAPFSDGQLQRLRAEGECLSFGGPGTDLPLQGDDTWATLTARLPQGWDPDFVALWLNYTTIPDFLWAAPLPLVGLAPDYPFQWHAQRRLLPRCEAVLTDASGVQVLGQHGIRHAAPAVLFGCPDSLLQQPAADQPRPMDVLFVGNAHPAVQRERLPWLGRLARLGRRWNVVITTGVHGADYHALLGQTRIVFNRSVRGEFNQRAAEALASGAVLFQEAGNPEVESRLRQGVDFVAYDEGSLETQLEYFLRHEPERLAIARSGQGRATEVTFTALFRQAVAALESHWSEITARRELRPHRSHEEVLLDRVWQGLSSTRRDVTLGLEVDNALRYQADDPALLTAAALTQFWAALDGAGRGGVRREGMARVVELLGRAHQSLPPHPLLGLNLAEALAILGERQPATDVARAALARLDHDQPLSRSFWDIPPFLVRFDHFRIEWERAAWAGGRAGIWGEVLAKRELLRWRLHGLLAELLEKGDEAIGHAYEEALARPDLPSTRAALGCALARAGRLTHALPHLRAAVVGNPWDAQALRALHDLLLERGDAVGAGRVAEEARGLHHAAPRLLPAQPWTNPADEAPQGEEQLPLRIIWEGPFGPIGSLALVNRQVTTGLAARGHAISRLPTDPGATPSKVPAEGVAPDVHVGLCWPPRMSPPPEGHWVAFQPWEYGSIPRNWADAVKAQADEVWVPSHFVRDCCLRGGLPPDLVHVVPLGTDPALFHPEVPPMPLPGRRTFAFLFVGGTLHRKGIDLLLEAFARAFTPTEDVCLILKDMGTQGFYRGQTAEGLIQRHQASGRTAPIIHLTQEWDDARMPGLYTACDCLVHPYRGEGFGLPIVEAMACGLPVIVPAHGPALELCDETSAYFVPSRTVRFEGSRLGDLDLVAPGGFGEVDVESLSATLRLAFDRRAERQSRGQAGRERVLRHWTWEHTARAIEARVQTLRGRPIRRHAARSGSATRFLHHVSPPAEISIPAEAVRTARVSLCVITRDEEANLRECIAPVRDLFHDVIVNDTGSKDGTVALAKCLGAKVVENPWQDSFATARNQSIEAATGDWIFWLDADDRVDAENSRRLAHLFSGLKPGLVGYALKCLCLPDRQSGRATQVDHIRLFPRRPDLRWEFRVHEQILPALNTLGSQVCWTDITIHHVGYQDTALRRRKLDRDRRLLDLDLKDRPDHPFVLFNLGSVLQEQGDHRQAVAALRQSLERSAAGDSITRKLYALLAGSHRALGEGEPALSACHAGLRLDPADAELLFQQGLLLREARDLPGAVQSLRALVTGQSATHFGSADPDLRGHRGLHLLGEVLAEAGDLVGAEETFGKAVSQKPGHIPSWRGLAGVHLTRNAWPQAEAVAQELDGLGAAVDAGVVRGRILLARKQFPEARNLLENLTTHHPHAVPLWVLLSYVLLQQGSDTAAAERALLRVLELDPSEAEARSNLAVLHRRRGTESS